MAAPATTARVYPPSPAKLLEDGHSTKIAFARDSNVAFFEKTVQPPGIDGGDPIEITNMHNTAWRTMVPRNLKTLTEFSVTAHYDPNVYTEIQNLINENGSVTVHFPDGSTLDFWGYLKAFEPSEHTEGEAPECTITVVPTNYDSTNRVEAAPVMTQVSGT